MPTCCLICTEELLDQSSAEDARRPCCGQGPCCPTCMYKHIQSMMEEGRRRLVCPLGCGKDISDEEVRSCFRQEHFSSFRNALGIILYYLCGGWWVTSRRRNDTSTCRHYRLWWRYLHSERERQDLIRYEKWSVKAALAQLLSKKEDEVVLRCPAADCDYTWLVANPTARRDKQTHERRPVYLWYSPPQPEKPVSPEWVEPDFLNIEVTGWIPQDIDESRNDGRRIACAKCAHVFCGLCRNPWSYERHKHCGVSCQRYARRLPHGWDTQDMMSWRTTRACPGCEMRTTRSSGCNHMTCPCGIEWCYACGALWNPMHYGCVDSNGRISAEDCVIL